jgi:hypothetical protein
MKWQQADGDWTRFRTLPELEELDLHRSGDPYEGSYWDLMSALADEVLNRLKQAQARGTKHLLVTRTQHVRGMEAYDRPLRGTAGDAESGGYAVHCAAKLYPARVGVRRSDSAVANTRVSLDTIRARAADGDRMLKPVFESRPRFR